MADKEILKTQLNKKVISGQDNDVTKNGVTYMGQDEKIREAQEILNWAIMHLNGSIKCKVIDYKHENYRVQVFTKENRLIMPIQITDSSRMRSSSPTAGTSSLNRLRKDSIIFLLYFLVAALWTAFTILPTNLNSFTSWTLLADSNFN